MTSGAERKRNGAGAVGLADDRPEVVVRGGIGLEEARRAEGAVRAVLARLDEPARFVRLRLAAQGEPGGPVRVLVQATVLVHGQKVRVQCAGPTVDAAMDQLCGGLGNRVEHAVRRPSGLPATDAPGRHLAYSAYPARPGAERMIMRCKTVHPAVRTVDGAALELDLLDHEFHLFVEAGSGQVSVLYRAPGGYRLLQANPRPDMVVHGGVPVRPSLTPAPRLTVPDAAHAMDESGRSFLFFIDADSGRSHVLYRRYDGHYAMLSTR
jgi:sigma 54 modulation/S30EA-like ribosomal protein